MMQIERDYADAFLVELRLANEHLRVMRFRVGVLMCIALAPVALFLLFMAIAMAATQ